MSTAIKENLQDLIDRINDLVTAQEDIIIDGNWRGKEYLESLRYEETTIHKLIKEAKLDDADDLLQRTKEELEPYLDISVVDQYTAANEIDSLIVGEIEIELPEDIQTELAALSPEEFELVRRNCCYIDDQRTFAYISLDYTRYILVFNVDDFYSDHERLPEIDDDAPKTKIDRLHAALDKISALDRELKTMSAPKLRVLDGKGLEPIDLMMHRLGRKFASPKSKAPLKLIKG